MADQQSENMPRPLPPSKRLMQLVAEKRIPDAPPIAPNPSPTTPTTPGAITYQPSTGPIPPNLMTELASRASWRAGVMGAVNVFTTILAVRLTLLIAVSGGISLTYVALRTPDLYQLIALATYCVAVVVPVVWLTATGR